MTNQPRDCKAEGQKFARVMEEAWLEQDRENALQAVRHVFIYIRKSEEIHNTEIIKRYNELDENPARWIELQNQRSLGRLEAYKIVCIKLKERTFPKGIPDACFEMFLNGKQYNKVSVTTD